MDKILKANIKVNLQFYRRNKLLLLIGILFLGIVGMTMIPSILFSTSNERFFLIITIFKTVTWFMSMMLALIALMSVWYHRSNKCIKLVFTRPCSPEKWVLGHFLSAALVFAAGLLLALLFYVSASLIWGIPLQRAITVSIIVSFVHGMLIYSYLLLLSSLMHPIVAGFIALVFSEGVFYWLAMMCQASAESITNTALSFVLYTLKNIFGSIYYVLPTMSPFEDKLQKLSTGLRISRAEWKYIAGILIYFLIFSAFSYFVTVYSLRKKRIN